MLTTDQQFQRLMKAYSICGVIGVAAARAGMNRKTGSKYVKLGKPPSQLCKPRTWRTRKDPFAEVWESKILPLLECDAALQARTIFEALLREDPDRFGPGQLRTLQRRIRRWRALCGPPKDVFFAQEHRAGEAAQTDFTHMKNLGITIAGEPFEHLVCHFALPCSNWEWVTVCRSESMAALRKGVQAAVFQLGSVPEWHQTDNSTGATHDLHTGKREFNDEYLALMRHLGMKPRTIAIGRKEQNGDIESLNGVFKRRIDQRLLLRSSRDFESVEAYEHWLREECTQFNRPRQVLLRDELAVMRPLCVERLPEYREAKVLVTQFSTIRVQHNTYSVPSRLMDEHVQVRIYEDRLEVYFAGQWQETIERLLGESGHRINYRHVIWSLVRKPGAFARYKYREDLFPTLAFRRAYDALRAARDERRADIDYLRILHLAASTMEADVETAIELLLETGSLPLFDAVKTLVAPDAVELPLIAALEADLSVYDSLVNLEEVS